MPIIGWQELLILLVILLIVFGAGKLAGVGSALGRSVRDFRDAAKDDNETAADSTATASVEPTTRDATQTR